MASVRGSRGARVITFGYPICAAEVGEPTIRGKLTPAPTLSPSAKEEHISIDADIALTIRRCFTLDITRLLLVFRYFIQLPELNPIRAASVPPLSAHQKSFGPKGGCNYCVCRVEFFSSWVRPASTVGASSRNILQDIAG